MKKVDIIERVGKCTNMSCASESSFLSTQQLVHYISYP